jgi:hypothetical protein
MECGKRMQCYRAATNPSKTIQVYGLFRPGGTNECKDYLPENNSGKSKK